jgi:hypothetical protein
MTTEPWREIHIGGSVESENAYFAGLAQEMAALQQQHAGAGARRRTLHAKTVVGVDAELTVDGEPAAGHLVPGARLQATVRLSNASGLIRPDTEADLRGIAVRLHLPGGGSHDLLATNYPVSHARDAGQFVTAAKIGSGPRALALPRMLRAFGPSETLRILGNVRRASRHCDSLAAESYHSRGAILWGDAGPVRFVLSPAAPAAPRTDIPAQDPQRLRLDFAARLKEAPVAFTLSLQRFVSEQRTPLEDGAVAWDEDLIPVATLTVPQHDLMGTDGERRHAEVDAMAFSPWNAPDEFRPLGSLNRARRAVYAASARGWTTS